MTETYHLPLVGAYYRPPAEGVLRAMPAGHELVLRAEPTNPFDPNAVMVLVKSASLAEGKSEALDAVRDVLSMHLQGYGIALEEFDKQEEWHIGYIAKQFARDLAPTLTGDLAGRLTFSGGNGKPMVEVVLGA